MEVAFCDERIAFGRALGRVESDISRIDGALLVLHDNLKALCETSECLITLIRSCLVNEISDEELRRTLVMISAMHLQLNTLANGREEIIGQREDSSSFWPEDMQDRLVDLVDDLEDLEETLALRLSPEFRKKLAVALESAQNAEKKAAPARQTSDR